MTTRSETLAANVEKALNDLFTAIDSSTPEQWAAPCTDAGWTQAVAAYHAATAIGGVAQTVKSVADGQPFPGMTMEQLDAQNAEQAKEHADCTVAETAAIVKASAADAVHIARSLTDDQLDRKVQLPNGMPEVSVEMFAQMAMIGHATYHLGTITGAR